LRKGRESGIKRDQKRGRTTTIIEKKGWESGIKRDQKRGRGDIGILHVKILFLSNSPRVWLILKGCFV
jgi:hypothetical protein